MIKAILTLLLTATAAFGQATFAGKATLGGAYTFAPAAGGGLTPDIAWWKFSENSGTSVADDSTRGTNTLTLSSASMWATGKTGYGIDGNNSSYYASVANFNCVTSIVTVAFWMNNPSWVNYDYFVELSTQADANNHAFAIDCGSTAIEGFLRGTLDGRHESTSVPSTGEWHHYLFVFDNSTTTGDVKLHIDGSEASMTIGLNSKTGADNFASYTLYLLSRAGASYFTDATIDDFRVYSGDRSGDVAAIVADPQ